MVCGYLNNLEQGQTETPHGTLRRRAEKSRRRNHLLRGSTTTNDTRPGDATIHQSINSKTFEFQLESLAI
jgi:hypothetical protein